jgi:exodeoxyribonuclease V alpha subunit
VQTIRGEFLKYLFYNETNNYSVIVLSNGYTAVGNLPKLNEGDELELQGDYTYHPKYGMQFQIVQYKIIYPTSNEGIVRYLSSGLIKGIGEKTAQKIFEKFGEKTLEIMDNDIERLIEVKGISKDKLESIKKSWEEQSEVRKTMIALQSLGISSTNALKIYKTYGKASEKIVEEDPYRLSYEVWGIGFKIADNIARNLGFGEQHPKRMEAAVIYILNEAFNDGHVYLTEPELYQKAFEMLNYDLSNDAIIINNLIKQRRIIVSDDRIYIAQLYYAERKIERILTDLAGEENEITELDNKYIEMVKSNFSDEQILAINYSLKHNLLVLTGGPGTGKTTTLRGIIELYQKKEKKIMLAAPTGRAAKRMTEIIGLEAKTIHRLLEFNPMDYSFGYNEDHKLETDLLIIDELSMIDTYLMYQLVIAIDNNTTVIFVGDVDQLPSIGAGNILHDIINSNRIPCVKLTKVFRQAETSKIITAAHSINKGLVPNINSKESDFIFIEEKNPLNIIEKIKQLTCEILPQRYKFTLEEDIQILSPMYRGEIGVNELNALFQKVYNKNDFAFSIGEKKYKINDKVMQLRNNYEKNVFNGDIGFIQSFDNEEKIIRISFDGRIVEYNPAEMDEITLAYAVTVHKSQGSEFPCVIMPISVSHYIMLQRNLVYTAITRASKLLIMIGEERALAIAVKNNKIQKRNSSLFKFNLLEKDLFDE